MLQFYHQFQYIPLECNYLGHQGENIKALCVNAKCQKNPAMCLKCSQQLHHKCQEHIIMMEEVLNIRIPFWQYIQKLIESSQIQFLPELDLFNKYINHPNSTNLKELGKFLKHYEQEYQQLCNNEDLDLENSGIPPQFLKNFKETKFLEKFKETIQNYKQQLANLTANYRGQVLLDQEKYQEAISLFDEIIKQEPQNYDALCNKGIALHKLKSYSVAIGYYELAIKIDKNNYLAFYRKGRSLHKQGRDQLAIDCHVKAQTLISNDNEDIIQKIEKAKGDALLQLGDLSGALVCYQNTSNNIGKVLSLQNPEEAYEFYQNEINNGLTDPILLNKLGCQLFKLQNPKSIQLAIDQFKKAIKLNPNYCLALTTLGSVLSSLKNYGEAYNCFEQAIKIDRKYLQAWVSKGWLLFEQNQHKEAIDSFSIAIPSCDAYIGLGFVLADLKQYQESIRQYTKAIQINPYSSDAWYMLGQVLYSNNQSSAALDCLKRAIDINPRNTVYLNEAAFQLQNQDRNEEAIEFLDKAIVIDNSHTQFLYIIEPLMLLKRFSEVISYSEKARYLYSKCDEAWNFQGVALSHMEKHEEAIVCYNTALEINPNNSIAEFNQGLSLAKLEKYEEALICFFKYFSIAPKDNNIVFHISNTLIQLCQYKEAVNFCEQSIKITPYTCQILCQKGIALHHLNKIDEAMACFIEAMYLDSQNLENWNILGLILQNLGEYDQSIICFTKIIELNPQCLDAYLQIGNMLFLQDKFKLAIIQCDEAIKINQKCDEACFLKGRALQKIGKDEEAIIYYDKAFKINKMHKSAEYHKVLLLLKLKQYSEVINMFQEQLLNGQIEGLQLCIIQIKLLGFLLLPSLQYQIANNYNFDSLWQNAIRVIKQLQSFQVKYFFQLLILINGGYDREIQVNGFKQIVRILQDQFNFIEYYLKLVRISDENLNNQGMALLKKSKFVEAIVFFDQIISSNPFQQIAWNNKGMALLELKNYKEAYECFRVAIDIDIQYPEPLNYIGIILYQVRNYKAAINNFQAALKADSLFLDAKNNIGVALICLKQFEEAIKYFNEVLEIDSEHSVALNNKGLALFFLDKYQDSIDCFEKVIKIDPGFVEVWLNKAMALLKLNKYEEGFKCINIQYFGTKTDAKKYVHNFRTINCFITHLSVYNYIKKLLDDKQFINQQNQVIEYFDTFEITEIESKGCENYNFIKEEEEKTYSNPISSENGLSQQFQDQKISTGQESVDEEEENFERSEYIQQSIEADGNTFQAYQNKQFE